MCTKIKEQLLLVRYQQGGPFSRFLVGLYFVNVLSSIKTLIKFRPVDAAGGKKVEGV